jgi:hypothetical protein
MEHSMQILANAINEDFENSKATNKRRDGVYKLPIELIEFFVVQKDLQKQIRFKDVEKYLAESGFRKGAAKFSGGKMKRCWLKPYYNGEGLWL